MATLLQEEYYDTLEYVCNIQQLGGDIKMSLSEFLCKYNFILSQI